MIEERLKKLSLESLRKIASNEGIKHIDEIGKDGLIEQLLEAMEEDRNERESSNNFAIRIEEKKYDIIQDEELESQEKTEYCVPEKYQETRIILILRDPYWAFAYWNVRDTDLDELKKNRFRGLFLRVIQEPREAKEGKRKSLDSFDIPVKITDDKWYINLPECGKRYYLELIGRSREGNKVLCTSNAVESPRYTIHDSIAEETLSSLNNPMLAFAGIFDLSDENNSQSIPQRIIQFVDATNNFHFKS